MGSAHKTNLQLELGIHIICCSDANIRYEGAGTILEKKIARHVYPCKTTTKYAIIKNYGSFKN